MAVKNNLKILVADNDERMRNYVSDMLTMRGYTVLQAIDGGTAIKVLEEKTVDLVIAAVSMIPRSGLDIARHLMLEKRKIGIIMLVDEITTDMLQQAGRYEINQLLEVPVEPDRLSEAVRRVLKSFGKTPDALGEVAAPSYTREQIMKRVLAMAEQNARARMGGPYAAIVTDAKGRILGEGVNSVTTRSDPTAHAEVIAIRRAAERTGAVRLDGCMIFCSSEPTMLGQALILSTGISKVYYALSFADIGGRPVHEEGILGEIDKPMHERSVAYEQIMHDAAQEMFETLKSERETGSAEKGV